MKESKITIDDLARMVANGFSEVKGEVHGLRQEMDRRFEQVDKRFDSAERGTEKGFREVRQEIAGLKQDVKDIKQELPYTATRFDVQNLDRRVTKLEKKAA